MCYMYNSRRLQKHPTNAATVSSNAVVEEKSNAQNTLPPYRHQIVATSQEAGPSVLPITPVKVIDLSHEDNFVNTPF